MGCRGPGEGCRRLGAGEGGARAAGPQKSPGVGGGTCLSQVSSLGSRDGLRDACLFIMFTLTETEPFTPLLLEALPVFN